MSQSFRIQTIAALLGVSPSTIRKAERAGRIPAAQRTRAGHRVYALEDVQTLAAMLYPTIELPSLFQPDVASVI